jgi:hypothetical protein
MNLIHPFLEEPLKEIPGALVSLNENIRVKLLEESRADLGIRKPRPKPPDPVLLENIIAPEEFVRPLTR